MTFIVFRKICNTTQCLILLTECMLKKIIQYTYILVKDAKISNWGYFILKEKNKGFD